MKLALLERAQKSDRSSVSRISVFVRYSPQDSHFLSLVTLSDGERTHEAHVTDAVLGDDQLEGKELFISLCLFVYI